MKNILVFILFLSGIYGFSQEVVIEKSDSIVNLNGNKFYIHQVQAKQTLFGISRAYDVDVSVIKETNKLESQGISINQYLQIPIIEKTAIEKKERKDTINYVYHTVEKGETVYGLSKKYNVSADIIYEVNPTAKNGLKLGSEIKIPRKDKNIVAEAFMTKKDTINYVYHTIKEKETLYSLSREFKVGRKVLKNENPDIDFRNLKIGSEIKIIRNKPFAIDVNEKANSFSDDSLVVDTLLKPATTPCDSFTYNNYQKAFNIAVLLPLYVAENIKYSEMREKNNQDLALLSRSKYFLKFYEGFLLAIDSIRKTGVKINLSTFDTGEDTTRLNSALNSVDVKNADLIIGPIHKPQLESVANFAKANKIPMINPVVQHNKILLNNEYLFQINPSFETQIPKIIDVFVDTIPKNYIIVSKGYGKEKIMSELYSKLIREKYKEAGYIDSINISEIKYMLKDFEPVEKALKPEVENVVIVPTTSQAYTYSVLTKLNTKVEDFHISVVGFPNWPDFENIELQYLHRLQLHYFSPLSIDYNSAKVQRFIKKFYEFYETDPKKYSYLGYDIGMFFINQLFMNGLAFKNCIESQKYIGLQSNFKFKKIEGGGFENTCTNIFMYDKKLNIHHLLLNPDAKLIKYLKEEEDKK